MGIVKNVRPGDRCKEYHGKAKAVIAGKCESCGQYAPYYCAWMDGTPKEIGCGHCLNKGTSVQPDGECKEWKARKKEPKEASLIVNKEG